MREKPWGYESNPYTGGKDNYFPFLTTTVPKQNSPKYPQRTTTKKRRYLEFLKICSVQWEFMIFSHRGIFTVTKHPMFSTVYFN